jgi:hypothetical protein
MYPIAGRSGFKFTEFDFRMSDGIILMIDGVGYICLAALAFYNIDIFNQNSYGSDSIIAVVLSKVKSYFWNEDVIYGSQEGNISQAKYQAKASIGISGLAIHALSLGAILSAVIDLYYWYSNMSDVYNYESLVIILQAAIQLTGVGLTYLCLRKHYAMGKNYIVWQWSAYVMLAATKSIQVLYQMDVIWTRESLDPLFLIVWGSLGAIALIMLLRNYWLAFHWVFKL